MGILNVTPDSFSDGGRYFGAQSALERALEMQKQGADIIDVGAQSTRPGASVISADEEIARLAPVFDKLQGKLYVPISVDTFYPEVAGYALKNGALIVNDVSGLPMTDMAKIVKKHNAGWIIMHNPGGQSGATSKIQYENGVIEALQAFFAGALKTAESFGISKHAICFDPGFGFGKTTSMHAELLKNLGVIKRNWQQNAAPATPLLVGLSRKRFVREVFSAETERELDIASAALHASAVKNSADIIRTHNVSLTKKVLEIL